MRLYTLWSVGEQKNRHRVKNIINQMRRSPHKMDVYVWTTPRNTSRCLIDNGYGREPNKNDFRELGSPQ
jgi:hypothetical protein